jgi:DNA-directed RNA polymerase sigma subunit (sigma70/sigma32)
MLIVSLDDFYEKVATMKKLSREEEKECAIKMAQGDMEARQMLINSYLPICAYRIKHHARPLRTMGLAVYYIRATEKAVDNFNFLQDSERFCHRLNWYLRNAMVAYIVRK